MDLSFPQGIYNVVTLNWWNKHNICSVKGSFVTTCNGLYMYWNVMFIFIFAIELIESWQNNPSLDKFEYKGGQILRLILKFYTHNKCKPYETVNLYNHLS